MRSPGCPSRSRSASTRGGVTCSRGWPSISRVAGTAHSARRACEARRDPLATPALPLAFSEAAGFPLARQLLELARELVERLVERQDDLGGARDVVAVEQAAVAVQVGEDRFGHLEGSLLRLDQRRLQRIDVVPTPEALVAHDRDLAIHAVDRVEIVLHADFLEDVRVPRIEAALFLDLAELAAPGTVESVAVVEQEDALGVVLAVRVLAVPDASLHACHPSPRVPPRALSILESRPRAGWGGDSQGPCRAMAGLPRSRSDRRRRNPLRLAPAHALRVVVPVADRGWGRPPTQVGRVLPRVAARESWARRMFRSGHTLPLRGLGLRSPPWSDAGGEPCRARDSSPTPSLGCLLPAPPDCQPCSAPDRVRMPVTRRARTRIPRSRAP